MAALIGVVLMVSGCGGTTTTTKTGTAPKPQDHTTTATHTKTTRRKPDTGLQQSRVGWRSYAGPVPILVYHDLGIAPASEPWPGLYMPYPMFRAEMQWLHGHGYEAITLDQLMDGWYHHGLLPPKPIVITFDNGYPPQVTFAPRVMGRYGWPGVLNEITVGHLPNSMIWHVLKLGWEVDSHSLTHPDLTTLTPSELHAQVAGSRSFLRHTFHIPVNSFCYPSSEYNSTVVAAVKAAGYTNAVTEGNAYATRANPFLLPRFEMTAGLSQLVADLAEPH